MRVYESPNYKNDFNKVQALHEMEVHDYEAQGTYDESVIRIYGTKTAILAEGWCEDLCTATEPFVLDYGCGTGQISKVLRRHTARVVAFDISAVSVQRNVENNGVVGFVANSFYLPFKDDSFDFVFINGVLHHIIDLERAISEIARVAKNIVFVSEGVPRQVPCLTSALSYPSSGLKFLYLQYLFLLLFRKFASGAWRKLKSIVRPPPADLPLSVVQQGSRYERALPAGDVERLFQANNFERVGFRYFTNIDLPGDGPLKKLLTKLLINSSVGTHFDFKFKKSKCC